MHNKLLSAIVQTRTVKGPARRGQTILEVTFSMIIIMFMIFGLVQVARWTVIDTVERRSKHDRMLKDYGTDADDVWKQLSPQGVRVRKIDMEYRNATP